jgi:hypothetical protein
MFNGAVWTRSYFTPKALLYHAAASAAAGPGDRSKTVDIMESDRVAKEVKVAERTVGERVVHGTIVTGVLASAAIAILKSKG